MYWIIIEIFKLHTIVPVKSDHLFIQQVNCLKGKETYQSSSKDAWILTSELDLKIVLLEYKLHVQNARNFNVRRSRLGMTRLEKSN